MLHFLRLSCLNILFDFPVTKIQVLTGTPVDVSLKHITFGQSGMFGKQLYTTSMITGHHRLKVIKLFQ